MPSLIDLRRRVRSIRNTQQITKAMKMVSAARLRRAQDRVINSRPYARMFNAMLANVAAAVAGDEHASAHPLLASREEKKVQLILITADRGLAGAFNANLIRAAQQFLDEHAGQQVELELFGRKGRDFFIRRPVNISGELTGVSQTASLKEAQVLADKLTARFTEGEIDAVYVLYNEFKSVLTQRVTLTKMLPLKVTQAAQAPDYIYEQPPAKMLEQLLPAYVLLQILEAFLETTAAEHAARMTAMDAATNNATDVINRLTLFINRVRQASITREIIEVVSGAAGAEG